MQTLKPDSGGSSPGSVPLCGLGLNESVSLCLPFLSVTEVNNSNCLTGLLWRLGVLMYESQQAVMLCYYYPWHCAPWLPVDTIQLMFVLCCSPASSEFFMDRLPFEVHKNSLLLFVCISLQSKRSVVSVDSSSCIQATLWWNSLKTVHLWSSDTGTGTQDGRIWKAWFSSPDHSRLGTVGRKENLPLLLPRASAHCLCILPHPVLDLSPFGQSLGPPHCNTPPNPSRESTLKLS